MTKSFKKLDLIGMLSIGWIGYQIFKEAVPIEKPVGIEEIEKVGEEAAYGEVTLQIPPIPLTNVKTEEEAEGIASKFVPSVHLTIKPLGWRLEWEPLMLPYGMTVNIPPRQLPLIAPWRAYKTAGDLRPKVQYSVAPPGFVLVFPPVKIEL